MSQSSRMSESSRMSQSSKMSGIEADSREMEELQLAVVLCHCKVSGKVITSRSKKNPGRRFVGCRNYKNDADPGCNYFAWLDEPTVAMVNALIKNLRLEIVELNDRVEGRPQIDGLKREKCEACFEKKGKVKDLKIKLRAANEECLGLKHSIVWYRIALTVVIVVVLSKWFV